MGQHWWMGLASPHDRCSLPACCRTAWPPAHWAACLPARWLQVEQNQAPVEDGQQKKGKGKSGKRFEIKKWNAVAMWSWAICTDTCAICRNNLYEPSIEYQANPTGG